VAQAGFAWPQVPAFHKVSGVWVVSGFWLRWRVGIRTLPTRLTRHSSGRGLCFAVLRLASSAAPLNWGVRHHRRNRGATTDRFTHGFTGKFDNGYVVIWTPAARACIAGAVSRHFALVMPNPPFKRTRVVFCVLRLVLPAAPLNVVVRRKRARPMGCFGIVGKIDVSPLGR